MKYIKLEMIIKLKEHDSYGCQTNTDWIYNTIEEQLNIDESIIDYKITNQEPDIITKAHK